VLTAPPAAARFLHSIHPDRRKDADSELTAADREHQEVSMLALHLLQSALVHVNTLLLQRVLAEPLSRRRWATSTGAR